MDHVGLTNKFGLTGEFSFRVFKLRRCGFGLQLDKALQTF
jgi:hypothetical protein